MAEPIEQEKKAACAAFQRAVAPSGEGRPPRLPPQAPPTMKAWRRTPAVHPSGSTRPLTPALPGSSRAPGR